MNEPTARPDDLIPIRIVSGWDRNIDTLPLFHELPPLLDAHPHCIYLHKCKTVDSFIEAIKRRSHVTIVICHGYPGDFEFGWGRNKRIHPSSIAHIGASSAIVLNTCNALGADGIHPSEKTRLAGGRALTGGIGVVQRIHLVWIAERLIAAHHDPNQCLSDAEGAKQALDLMRGEFALRRDSRLTDEAKQHASWDRIWSPPEIVS